jgi:hypothetical protein
MQATEEREAVISVLGRRIETVKLPADPKALRANYAALEGFLEGVDVPAYQHDDTFRGYRLWKEVPKGQVADLLERFKAHSTAEIFSQSVLSKFVRGNGTTRFRTWDVVLVNGPKTGDPGEVADVKFIPPSRTFVTGGPTEPKELRLGGRSARLAGADDLANLLGQQRANAIREEYRAREGSDNMPEAEFYSHLERPALLIYALKAAEYKPGQGSSTDTKQAEKQAEKRAKVQEATDIIDEAGVLVVALKLAFPGDKFRDTSGDITYIINKVALRTWFPTFEEVSDDADFDDEDVDA